MKDWEKLQSDINTWADKEFGSDVHISRVKHLKEEVEELEETYFCYQNPDVLKLAVATELADVLILATHIAHTHGVDLFQAVSEKFVEVQTRTWYPPDADGIIRHVKK
jgi:NTP pyrophosphatase (non-canonical NTP hydrolase)